MIGGGVGRRVTVGKNSAAARDRAGNHDDHAAATRTRRAGRIIGVARATAATKEEASIADNRGIVGERPSAESAALATVVAAPAGIARRNRQCILIVCAVGVTTATTARRGGRRCQRPIDVPSRVPRRC